MNNISLPRFILSILLISIVTTVVSFNIYKKNPGDAGKPAAFPENYIVTNFTIRPHKPHIFLSVLQRFNFFAFINS